MSSPLVSVCMPTRNQGRWIGHAIDSVLAQTLQSFEIVVGDDASTDDTAAAVRRRPDPRLRYLRHPRPLGVAGNRNACLAVARGRYVAWLDSDDLHHPEMLATQVAALERHPSAVLAHGGFDVIDEDGELLPAWPQPFAGDVVEPGATAFRELVLRNYVAAPTVVVRRRAHDEAGPYRTSLASGEDWEMWLRLALDGDLVYTARRIAQYRWHSGSLTRSAEASYAQLERDFRVVSGIFRRHGARIPRRRELERRARCALVARALRRATDFLTRRERRMALACLLVAWRARPILVLDGTTWRLAGALLRRAEYSWHQASRALLGELGEELANSRMAAELRRASAADPEWEKTLRDIARTVRGVVPPSASIAVVDKWDPTVLHLSRRVGWHYPDRSTLHDGYPADSATAIDHLEELRCRGASYLVVPSCSFWWLEHYRDLARHLELAGECVWRDEHCLIYRLLAIDEPRSRTVGSTCRAASS